MPTKYISPPKQLPKSPASGRRAQTTEELLAEIERKRKERDKAVNKRAKDK